MTDTTETPTSYGWAAGPSRFGPRGIVGRPERSHLGNVVLHVGKEVPPGKFAWTKVAHVVLEPQEARAFLADVARQLDPDAPVGPQPPPPAILSSYLRDDGALVLNIKPVGDDLAAYPLVITVGDVTVVDETDVPSDALVDYDVAARRDRSALDRIAALVLAGADLDGSDAGEVTDILRSTGRLG